MKNTVSTQASSNKEVIKGAVSTGVINAAINGGVQFYLLRGTSAIPLSVDGITNEAVTVLGTAVPLAVSLAMILTVIAFLSLKTAKRTFFPDVLWLTIKHGIFTFGLCVTGAVVWQRIMGSIPVSLTTAVAILAVIAGLAAGIINYMTIRVSVLTSQK